MSTTTVTVEAPDAEEYQVIIEGLRTAKVRLYQLLTADALRQAPCPEGYRKHFPNLLSYLQLDTRVKVQQAGLDQDIAAGRTHVAVLQGLLDNWNDRQKAFEAANIGVDADDL